MEIFNVITLNNHDYVISALVTWENRDYALLEEINQKEDMVNNRLIGRFVIKNGEDAIEVVTNNDSLEYKIVSRLFFSLLAKK